MFFNFLLRMDCSPGANGNGAESFKKTQKYLGTYLIKRYGIVASEWAAGKT
jgi:hypothetical protein